MTRSHNRGKKCRNLTPYYKYKSEDLTCRICNKVYDKEGFLSNKLGELAKMLTDYNGIGSRYRVVCKRCAPKENTHILCANCLINKPLSKYSKSQRSCNGNPRCISCIKEFIEEDVESSGAEYSDLGPTIANNNHFSTQFHQSDSLNDQFSAMSIGSPTSNLTTTGTNESTAIQLNESFQSLNADSTISLNTNISSLYQLVRTKDPPTKSHADSLSNDPEISEVTISSIKCIKSDLDPIHEALDQFPNLKDFLPNTNSISKPALDKRIQ